jgi:gliding motility-associated-like protein
MQRLVIGVVVWLVAGLLGHTQGQNLVPNGGFENYRNCPHTANLLAEATPWYNPNRATPDFYHNCFPTGQVPLPPHSGEGVADLYFDQGWEEYLGVQLTEVLKAGECYYFEMYVATETPAKYLAETLGVHFSAQPLSSTTTELFNVVPQILDNRTRASVEALKWYKLSGTFKARGGEHYITIGDFGRYPPFLGYYYVFIDDVALIPTHLNLGRDTTLCGRQSTRLLDATVPGAIDYNWSDGSIKPELLVTKPGTYTVSVTTSCTILRDTITIDYALDFDLGPDTTLCQGEALRLSVPANAAATYRWQDGSEQNIFTVRQTGLYSIRVTQANCIVTDSIRARFIPPPKLDLGPDQELCGLATFTIKPTVSEGKFSWQDQFASVERMVNKAGVFWAKVVNDCATVTDSIAIDYGACDCVLYAPNLFTPNNDGQNDVFVPLGCGDITITSLTIFNRWGEVVYYTTSPPFQWDGNYHGEPGPIGVYAWSVQYQLSRHNKITAGQQQGPLSLIR